MPSSLNGGPVFHFLGIGKMGRQVAGKLRVFTGAGIQIDAGGTFTNAGTQTITGVMVIPTGVKPGTCVVGQLMGDSADGNKLYQCTATNTWTKVGTQT